MKFFLLTNLIFIPFVFSDQLIDLVSGENYRIESCVKKGRVFEVRACFMSDTETCKSTYPIQRFRCFKGAVCGLEHYLDAARIDLLDDKDSSGNLWNTYSFKGKKVKFFSSMDLYEINKDKAEFSSIFIAPSRDRYQVPRVLFSEEGSVFFKEIIKSGSVCPPGDDRGKQ